MEGPIEWGVPPAALNIKGEKKARNMMLIDIGAEKAVEEGLICLAQYPKVKNAIELYKAVTTKHTDLDVLDNKWIYGLPGCGKSRQARIDYPDLYDKPLNKWWCDYNG